MNPASAPEPVAIIGIGCRYPGARGPTAFWQLLREGREEIREIPPDRFDIDQYYEPTPGKSGRIVTRRGGFIQGVDLFDPGFFGISPREAINMDPQQRLLLEVTEEALDDAGTPLSSLARNPAGVFVGVSSSDYSDLQLHVHDSSTMDPYTLPGTARSLLAGRLSRILNLTGPSVVIDTACSSSLVAAHLACHSLWNGECTLALVGGVNLLLTPEPWAVLSQARMLSPDGRSRAFDAGANGFVRGEGAGIVVLKLLTRAQVDGDPIYAIIRGSAINNDGFSGSVMTPNQQAQEAVLRAAYCHAAVSPGKVQYVEAHGTGTIVGDPIEARALGAVLAQDRTPDRPCLIGSVKTNIGHLEGGAGIAGLIKAALCIKHGAIPPSLHCSTPNPAILWDNLPLVVQTVLTEWPVSDGPAVAGVSSFGISGTNVHMVLSDAPSALSEVPPDSADTAHILPLSAHTSEALTQTVEQFGNFLCDKYQTSSLRDICYSSGTRRSHYAHRLAFVGRSRDELIAQLAAHSENSASMRNGTVPSDERDGPVFVFSGQGPQFWPLDRRLLTQFPLFRETLLHCEELLRMHGADWRLEDLLFTGNDNSPLHETDVCQVAIFACQVALASLWRTWGIEPAAVIGHSLGEVAAAYVSGAISLEQAIGIVVHRGRITKQISGCGAMALVGISEAEASIEIEGYQSVLAVAAVNSPTTCVLSGDPLVLAETLTVFQRKGIFVRELRGINYAAHSPQIEPLKHQLQTALATLGPQLTSTPMYSTVIAAPVAGPELVARYWADNLRETVRFDQTLRTILADGKRLFLEVHPDQVLLHSIRETSDYLGVKGVAYPSLRRDSDGPATLLRSLGSLYTHGCKVRWANIYPSCGRHVSLPSVAWQKRRYWLPGDPRPQGPGVGPIIGRHSRHPLLGQHIQSAADLHVHIVQTDLGINHPRYLTDHRIQGAAILPAAVYVEMALAIARELRGPETYLLEDMSFEKALFLPESGPVVVQAIATEANEALAIQFYGRLASDEELPWTLHAKGIIRIASADDEQSFADQSLAERSLLSTFQSEDNNPVSGSNHYQLMAANGLDYGPYFRGIRSIWQRDGETLAELDLPQAVKESAASYQLHPVLLDLAFQSVAAALYSERPPQNGGYYLPVALNAVRIHRSPEKAVYAHATIPPQQPTGDHRIRANVLLMDNSGNVLVEACGLMLQRLKSNSPNDPEELDRYLYHVEWQPQGLPDPTVVTQADSGRWLIVTDRTGLGDAVAYGLRAQGSECTVVRTTGTSHERFSFGNAASVRQRIAHFLQQGKPPRGVVYLAALDTKVVSEDHEPSAQPELFGLLHLVQTLVEQEWITPPRLWIVTRGAQMVLKSDLIELNQTPIWGLARTIANEHPQLRCSNIDLAAAPHVDDAVGVHAEILADQQEDRVVYRKGERRVARLVRYDPIPIGLQRPARPGEAYRLETAKPGMLDNLIWRAVDREPPEPDQVEIQVHSAGLNFLDVLTALGLHPDQTHGDSILGMECAGVVSRVGCHVVGIRVGDRVVAIAPHSFGAYTRTLSNMVAVLPENLNCHDASTVPIAYLTAYYALCTLGRLQRGERILIHAAAGGVGLAAVHLAQRIGAEIFATAGNAEKREFLHNLGIEHVMDSRSLHFAAEVWTKTNEEGVDVVLNSLAGEVIPKSLSLLRANGRFLEIGKRDIYGRTQLDMGLLKRNIAFFAVDLIPLLAQQPRLCGELLRDVVDRLSKSDLPPLPYTQFSRSEIKKAFHFMAKARHIGKVIIGLDERTDDAVVQIAPQSMTSLRSNATYLITGGLGGLGLSVAAQIVDRGARHLVLLGRNGPSAEALEMLTSLQMRGAEVITVQADVTKEADVCSVLRQIQASLPPLRGIFHAAGVLDDGLLVQMNRDDLERVMAPKVQGTWLLHKYTQTLDLDLFVLFSSIASIVGSPGQGNYVAANSFLDGLAHYRQQQGLPALAINWGPWGEVGMAAGASVTQFLLQQGIRAFPPRLGIELLERILDTSAVQITAFDVDWPQMLQRFPSPFLQKMVEETEAGTNLGSAKTSTVLRNRLLALAPIKRRQAVMNQLLNQVSQVTRMPLEQIDIYLPLSQQGIDSLMATELATRIKTDLDVSLPLPTLLQGPTVVNLAETVMKLLGPSTSSENVPGTTVTSIVDGEASDDHFALSIVALRNEAFLDPMIQFASAVTEKRSTGGHLFLTGPTGFLGTFLLRDLLLNTDFQIYCLVRAADPITGRERVLRSLKHFFPDEALHLDRVTAVLGDLQAPDLGLSQSEFDWFSEQMDLIIHCGAAVNWLAPYEHLKPTNVLGTQAVIRLAAQRRLTPLHYISSLAIFPLVGNDRLTMIDENTSLDHGGILYGGYTQSKWVAEKLIAVAQDRGLPISIYRPSLIVGHSEKGTWQDDGIIARMLRSWINLGFAPDLDARLDLVPVNYVSRAIVHLSLDDHERKTTTYHLCSSRAVTVQNLIDWLNGCGYSVRKIPYDQWRHLILNRENLSQQTLLSSVGPLLALQTSENVDWIRYIPNFGDRQTREVLNGLNCSLVDASTFQLYSSYFRRTGFFPAAPNG